MVAFCLFGAGLIGKVHAANIAAHPEASLRTVVDVDAQAGRLLADQHGAAFSDDAAAAIGDPDIDAVLIASDGRTHADIAIPAARAGKAIFCEKPLDLDLGRAEACAREVEAAAVPFQIGFHRRFDQSFRALRAAVEGGEVGRVELVCITSRDAEIPPLEYFERTPGGMWKDMLIHDFDVAAWLLGEEPTEVFAAASCLIEPELARLGEVDTAVVTLKTASGAMAQINASLRTTYGYDQRAEVFGSKGMVALSNLRPTAVERYTGAGTRRDNPVTFFLDRYRDCYSAELDHFVAAVRDGTPPSPGLRDGLRGIRLAEAAMHAHCGGSAVTVPS